VKSVINFFKNIFGGEPGCAEVREASSEFLEADLPPPRMATFQAHLNKCGPCLAFVETLSATIGMLTRLPRVSAPPSFKQSIIERTRQEDQSNQ
jgi:hypothetical protein